MTTTLFKVARNIEHDEKSLLMGMGDKSIEYPLTGTDRILYSFIMPDGSEFGVQFNGDGTYEIGSWDSNGEWVKLVLDEDDGSPHFDLKAYHSSWLVSDE